MTVRNIINAALAHCYEEADKDTLTRNLTVALVNLGIADLTDAENAIRMNDPDFGRPATDNARVVELVTEPPQVTKPEDNVPYDYRITTILLPLWLAWKVWDGLEDFKQAATYRSLYEQRRSELIPVVWEQAHDMNGCRW